MSQTMRKWIAPLLATGCLFGLGLVSPAFPQDLGRYGTVYLRIVSPNGFHARKATITVSSDEGRRTYADHVKGFTVEHLPYGRYTIAVDTPMLRTKPTDVVVNAEAVYATLTFPYENPAERWVPPPPAVLHGVVQGTLPSSKPAWIKLVGVYSGEIAETQTNAQGEFEFRGLTDGVYEVIATRDGAAPVSALVRVRERSATVSVAFQ